MFRILATLMVLVVHFTGWFVDGPSDFFNDAFPLSMRIGQHLICSMCVVCVNMFLIISGWYGVKLSFSSLWKIWTILVAAYIPCYIASVAYFGHFSMKALGSGFIAFSRESYFVQCYLMLMFFSPVINLFFEKYRENTLKYVLVFWGIEVFMETICNNKSLCFEEGYSLIHFVLMYMLARSLSYRKEQILHVKRYVWVLGYLACTAIYFLLSIYKFKHIGYSCPVVVLSSFCLFIPFLYRSFYNKWVNWIAASTFMVFILHTCSPVSTVLVWLDNYLLMRFPYGIYLFSYLFVCAITFFACIFYDKIRMKIVDMCLKRPYDYLKKQTSGFFIYQ